MQNQEDYNQTALNDSLITSILLPDSLNATSLLQRPNPIMSATISKHHKYNSHNLIRKHHIKGIVSFDSKQAGQDVYWWDKERKSKLRASLEGFKALTHLQLIEDMRYKSFNRRAASSLKHLSRLSRITLVSHTNSTYWTMLQSVSRCIRYLKSLSTLQIGCQSVSSAARITSDFQMLFSNLKCVDSLTSLSLLLDSNISDKAINNLCCTFRRFTSLRKLSLDIRSCCYISKEVGQELMASLQYLSNLTTLNLNINSKVLSPQYFDHLCISLERMTNLSTLQIDLSYYTASFYIANIRLKGLFETLRQLSTLKILVINCAAHWSYLTNDELISLSLSLKHLVSLSTLHLDFSNCLRITKKGVKKLSSSLRCLPLLSDVSLNFSCLKCISPMTDDSVKCLSAALQSVPSLLSLKLDFEHCKNIHGDVFKDLTEAVRHATHLHTLILNFSGHGCSTLEAPDKLFIVLGSLVCLVELRMNFSYFEGFTDKSVSPLATSLKQLICLSRLKLEFRSSDSLTENFVVAIFENIKSHAKLSDLKMYFTLRPRAFRRSAIRRITDEKYFRCLKTFVLNRLKIRGDYSY